MYSWNMCYKLDFYQIRIDATGERAIWIRAKKSTHYIHLTEPEIIVESLNIVEQIY